MFTTCHGHCQRVYTEFIERQTTKLGHFLTSRMSHLGANDFRGEVVRSSAHRVCTAACSLGEAEIHQLKENNNIAICRQSLLRLFAWCKFGIVYGKLQYVAT